METVLDAWTEFATRVLAPNPGPMTGDGTNTFVVRHPGSHHTVVVDPGPRSTHHLSTIQQLGKVELILLTHRHKDHAESAARLAESTGAPVRAADRALCRDARPLRDGEVILVAGSRINVVSTPGHTDDSVCFHLPDDTLLDPLGSPGAVLTGDTILGAGTTLVASFERSLGAYLASIERLRAIGSAAVLPGHGPLRDNLALVCDHYLEHRRRRLSETRAALRRTGRVADVDDATVESVVDDLYADLHPLRRRGAVVMTRANLAHLIGEEEASVAGGCSCSSTHKPASGHARGAQ